MPAKPLKEVQTQNQQRPKSSIYKPPMPGPKAEEPKESTALERIQRQIEDFHKLKDECLDDLESCMDELESHVGEDGERVIRLPEDFDAQVMEAAEDQR